MRLPKFRNSKSEIRNKFEYQNSKCKTPPFGFRYLNLEFVSDFDIRLSNFSLPTNCPRLTKRRGYTLFEIVIALSISMFVLYGLYTALFTQLNLSKSGRELMQQASLAQTLFTKINNDITSHLGPATPWLKTNFPTSSGTTNSSGTTDGTTKSGSTPAPATEQTTPPETTDSTGGFNRGVQGEGQSVRLSLSRYPRKGKDDFPVCDLCRIDYWMVPDVGLARREVTRILADEENVDPSSLPNQEKYVIAPEVKSLSFRYWDGSAWQDTWKGTDYGEDGETQLGPPAAIEITIEVETKFGRGDEGVRKYRHVVAIPTANIGSSPTTIAP